MPDLSNDVAWWIVAGARTGLVVIAFVLERPILNLRRPTPGAAALIAVVVVLSAVLVFGAYLLTF